MVHCAQRASRRMLVQGCLFRNQEVEVAVIAFNVSNNPDATPTCNLALV